MNYFAAVAKKSHYLLNGNGALSLVFCYMLTSVQIRASVAIKNSMSPKLPNPMKRQKIGVVIVPRAAQPVIISRAG